MSDKMRAVGNKALTLPPLRTQAKLTLHTDIKNGTGPATSLYINDQTPKPKAESGQAIVKIKAFGLNRMDLLQREGHYPLPPQAPKTLGVEFSGTIEELGPGIKEGFKKGDEVFGLAYGGAYAEYIAVNTHMLLHKPGHLSWEQAAGIPEVSGSSLLVTSDEKANEKV
jgi:NADPH:quinone reductase-like Zn-dependent oxidoreductase